MSDALIRERTKDIPVPEFPIPAFVTPPPLNKATVAIVTTAGLKRPDEPGWKNGDESYRAFAADEEGLICGHLSPNFDRTGLVADLNVAYPIGRLKEMAADGTIGGVAPKHISFMGALGETMTTLRMRTGPAAAHELLEAGVDVVLLTPV